MIPSGEFALPVELTAVTQGFGHMTTPHSLAMVEVGEGPGYPQGAIVTARRQLRRLRRLTEQRAGFRVHADDFIQALDWTIGVGPHASQTQGLIASSLDLASVRHPGANLGAAFGRRRHDQFSRADRRHLDLHVDPVKQRARDAGLVFFGAVLPPAAGEAGLTGMTAAAGVHRGDQLDARRIGNAVIGPGDGNLSGLERLAK